MLKLEQKNTQTNQPTNRQGKNNMSPTTIVGDIKMLIMKQNKQITFNMFIDDKMFLNM